MVLKICIALLVFLILLLFFWGVLIGMLFNYHDELSSFKFTLDCIDNSLTKVESIVRVNLDKKESGEENE